MNEQDMILKQKIEKREKVDTILAYILIVILLGGIILVLVLKFTREEEVVDGPEEYVPNYISVSEISSLLNSSILANRYTNDNALFNTSVSGNSIVVSYVKEDTNINLNVPMVGNELMFSLDENNSEVITEVYEEVANIVCMYYGNEEKYCRNTIDNMDENSIDGIRIVNTDNTSTVYVNTTNGITVNNNIVYKEITEVSINEYDYVLEMLDTKISNISVVNSDTNIKFNGTIDRLSDDASNVSVIVRLYDKDSTLLGENKYEYNEENVLESTGTFEIEFLFNATLKLDNINTYSIEIVK